VIKTNHTVIGRSSHVRCDGDGSVMTRCQVEGISELFLLYEKNAATHRYQIICNVHQRKTTYVAQTMQNKLLNFVEARFLDLL